MSKVTNNIYGLLACIISTFLLSFTVSHHRGRLFLIICLAVSLPLSVAVFKLLTAIKERWSGFTRSATPNKPTTLTLKEYIFSIITAVTIVTLMSTSSPLYPTNLWDDTNVYFTMGRVVLHGIVPYRDIYEQKGPMWFLIQALCASISERSFIGVYLLETLMCIVFLIFSLKIVHLFVPSTKKSNAFIVLLPVASTIYSSNMFHFGGSTEEFAFPLLVIVLYFSLKALRQEKVLPSMTEVFITGILFGLLFWIKYTLCAFIIGFLLYFFIYSLIIKNVAGLIRSIASFLGGFALISLPVAAYYISNKAISDLLKIYFYDNITVHSGIEVEQENSLPTIIHNVLIIPSGFSVGFYCNIGLLILLLVAVISFGLFEKRITVFLLTTFLITLIVCYMKDGMFIFYYGFVLMMFSTISMIIFAAIYEAINAKLVNKSSIAAIIPAFILVLVSFTVLLNGKNLFLLGKPYNETPQYKFAQIINETEDANILTYDVMDWGFYTASGELPSNKYYCSLIIGYTFPEIRQSQLALIEQEYFDYIITYSNEYDWDGYEIVDQAEYTLPYPDGQLYLEHVFLYRKCISR